MDDLSRYEQRILEHLYSHDEPCTAYGLSEYIDMHHTTVYVHCCHLLSRRLIDTKYVKVGKTFNTKQVWFISKAGQDHMLRTILDDDGDLR